MQLSTAKVDVLKVGSAYFHFLGDIPRTAVCARVPEDVVRQLVREHDWAAKLEACQKTRLSLKGEDDEKQINRTQNLLQSYRLRDLLDKVVSTLLESDEKDLVEFFTRTDPKTGDTVAETKPLVDIARTAEIVHTLTYRALGDTVAAKEGGQKSEDVALAVAGALNKVLDRLPGPPAPIKVAEVIDVD